jgi:3-methylfumaryl-CoA hydratase
MRPLANETDGFEAFVGRTEVRSEVLSVETLRRFAAAVGTELDVERQPPPLAHWAFFLDVVDRAALGEDGHPARGGFMPPVPLPRRMFSASAIRFIGPLVLGAAGELRLTIANVERRIGKSGELVFVEVDRSIVQDGAERVGERQTIVYRAAGPVAAVEPIDGTADTAVWTPGSAELFRFSAVTFNAHRIPYDLDYAQKAEGYPGLVVHGPLTAVKLFALASLAGPIREFTFRANAPLFAGQPVRLTWGEPGTVQAVRCDGVTAMSAKVR